MAKFSYMFSVLQMRPKTLGLESGVDCMIMPLSIDEKAFKKGHNYIAVLSHPASGCILEVEEHRTKESCKSLLNKSLTEDQLARVTTISMDIRAAGAVESIRQHIQRNVARRRDRP